MRCGQPYVLLLQHNGVGSRSAAVQARKRALALAQAMQYLASPPFVLTRTRIPPFDSHPDPSLW